MHEPAHRSWVVGGCVCVRLGTPTVTVAETAIYWHGPGFGREVRGQEFQAVWNGLRTAALPCAT